MSILPEYLPQMIIRGVDIPRSNYIINSPHRGDHALHIQTPMYDSPTS